MTPSRRAGAPLAAAAALAALVTLDTGCRSPRYFDPGLARASVDAAFQQWTVASAMLDPGAATVRGDHRTDFELEPLTSARVSAFIDRLRMAKSDLETYWSPQAQGDAAADHDLVLARIQADLIAFDQLRIHERDLSWSAQVAYRALTSVEYAPDLTADDRTQAMTARMRALDGYFRGVRDTARNPWQIQTEQAVVVTEALLDFVDSDPLARLGAAEAVAEVATEAARAASKEHLEWLQQKVTIGPQGHHRVNRVLFEALLKAESGLDIDASRVAEAAQSELEGARRKFEAQALTLLKTTDPKASDEDLERAVSAALRAIAADRPLDAHTLDALSRQATSETLAFARTAGLVTIPESLRVSTAVERGAVDGGALAASDAFFSPRTRVTTAVVKVSTPTAVLPAAAQEEWLSALSPSRLRILALAEGAPGLAVLRAAQSQNRSHIRRKLGCQGVDRGWADYARRIAVDAGYGANDTSVKLAGLSMDMVVAARALCAARIHAGTMTVTEARETFRRQALLPGEVANLEARRCASDPLVALELVGRKELERLVADVGAKRSLTLAGARDRILNTGPLPFETLRLVLLPARAD